MTTTLSVGSDDCGVYYNSYNRKILAETQFLVSNKKGKIVTGDILIDIYPFNIYKDGRHALKAIRNILQQRSISEMSEDTLHICKLLKILYGNHFESFYKKLFNLHLVTHIKSCGRRNTDTVITMLVNDITTRESKYTYCTWKDDQEYFVPVTHIT